MSCASQLNIEIGQYYCPIKFMAGFGFSHKYGAIKNDFSLKDMLRFMLNSDFHYFYGLNVYSEAEFYCQALQLHRQACANTKDTIRSALLMRQAQFVW
jgi:hypothetical protein